MQLTALQKGIVFMHAVVDPVMCWQVAKYVYGRTGFSQRMSSRLKVARNLEFVERVHVEGRVYFKSQLTRLGHLHALKIRSETKRQRTIFERYEVGMPEHEYWLVDLVLLRSDERLLELADYLEHQGDSRAYEIRDSIRKRKFFEKGLVGQL